MKKVWNILSTAIPIAIILFCFLGFLFAPKAKMYSSPLPPEEFGRHRTPGLAEPEGKRNGRSIHPSVESESKGDM